jgi:hypothetical protein
MELAGAVMAEVATAAAVLVGPDGVTDLVAAEARGDLVVTSVEATTVNLASEAAYSYDPRPDVTAYEAACIAGCFHECVAASPWAPSPLARLVERCGEAVMRHFVRID